MKTTKLFVLVFLLIISCSVIKAQIYSTTNGGNWADTTTWIGYKVPGVNDAVIIQGPVTFYFTNANIKHLHLKEGGALVDGWNSTLRISGNYQIDADITAGPPQVYVGGNLEINKKWSGNTALNFVGVIDHYIKIGENAEFGPQQIISDSSRLIALSHFKVKSDYITTITIKEIDLSRGFNLYLTNCRLGINSSIHPVTIVKGAGNNIYFNSNMGLQHFFENCELQNVNLHGYSVFNSNVKFSGTVTNIDTMVAGFTPQPIKIEGEFINNGAIPNRYLSFNCYGNIVNNGLFEVNSLNFIGNNDFKIKTSVSKYIDCLSLNVNDGNLIANSDLYLKANSFVAKEFNLDNYNVIALDTRFGTWNSPYKTKISGNGKSLTMYSSSYGSWYENCDLYDIILKGKSVLGNNIKFYGNVVNEDTLYNMDSPAYQYFVDVEGELTNEGYVGFIKGFNIKGNFKENGIWQALNVALIGNNNQTVNYPNIIEGKVEFHSNIVGTSYQWQKNGVNIQNANSPVLTFNTLTENDYGIYKCVTNNGDSRLIILEKFNNLEFKIYDVEIFNLSQTSTKINWKTTLPATGFIFYAENDTTNGFPFEAPEDGNYKTEHSITLTGLNYNSHYYFIIDQNDENYNNIRSATYGFIAGDSTVSVNEDAQPYSFYLSQNYPNPFNPTTTINFSIPKTSNVQLLIFDVLGKQVEKLIDDEYEPGNYTEKWNAINLVSGIYFYKLSTMGFSSIKKMILVK